MTPDFAPMVHCRMRMLHHTARHVRSVFRGSRSLASAASSTTKDVDIVIAGGGLVGASLAVGLASHPLARNLSITVVDPRPHSILDVDGREGPSTRTSTISPSSAAFLKEIGVWSKVRRESIASFDDMLVWDCSSHSMRERRKGPGIIHFSASDLGGAPELGYVTDNDTLLRALYERLSDLSMPHLNISKAVVDSIVFANDERGSGHEGCDWPVVELSNGETVRARLIVAADGARSRVRSMTGLDWFSHSYQEVAVVANVLLDKPIACAYQRFLTTGPVAMLPMASNGKPLANVIWSTVTAEGDALMGADSSVFCDEVNIALHEDDPSAEKSSMDAFISVADLSVRGSNDGNLSASHNLFDLPTCTGVLGSRGKFPLALGHAPKYVDGEKRVVLIGDAAHNVHPLAGQGVNLGFADARSLMQSITKAVAVGRDPGGENGAPLMQYERDRIAANSAMLVTLHGLHAVFGLNAWRPFHMLRRLGISAVDNLTPLKRKIVEIMS